MNLRIAALAGATALLLTPAADAATSTHRHHRLPKPRGGAVHKAWPAKGAKGKPKGALAQWLARQVGPTKVRRTTRAAAQAAAASPTGIISFQSTGTTGALQLLRSYQIPTDDPAAARLANLSWTYDSAVSAIAFAESGSTTQAQQVLDQLAALQRSDGSIDFAFNTATGQSVPRFRSGTVAWTGLAAVDYRAKTCSTRYDAVAYAAAKWLLGEQVTDTASASLGLVLGGPDVTWASAQHNLVTRAFLDALANEIDGVAAGTGYSRCASGLSGLSSTAAATFSATLRKAVTALDAGISRALFVKTSTTSASFREGVGDEVRPLDAQALGILWLIGQGRRADATAVATATDASMLVSGRTIATSTASGTYNQSYTAKGPFTGYRPYAEAASPNVLWMEGTLEQRFARDALGLDTGALDLSIYSWQSLTPSTGPLQADRTVTDSTYNEYHVWPAGAAGAWELLNFTGFGLLA